MNHLCDVSQRERERERERVEKTLQRLAVGDWSAQSQTIPVDSRSEVRL